MPGSPGVAPPTPGPGAPSCPRTRACPVALQQRPRWVSTPPWACVRCRQAVDPLPPLARPRSAAAPLTASDQPALAWLKHRIAAESRRSEQPHAQWVHLRPGVPLVDSGDARSNRCPGWSARTGFESAGVSPGLESQLWCVATHRCHGGDSGQPDPVGPKLGSSTSMT